MFLKCVHIFAAIINVVVEDVNDNNPKFSKPFYRFTVPENSKTGLHIGTVSATDADKNKTVIYSLEGTPDVVKMIYLDSNSGDLIVSSRIDHENHTWLNLTVSQPKNTKLLKIAIDLFVGEGN